MADYAPLVSPTCWSRSTRLSRGIHRRLDRHFPGIAEFALKLRNQRIMELLGRSASPRLDLVDDGRAEGEAAGEPAAVADILFEADDMRGDVGETGGKQRILD